MWLLSTMNVRLRIKLEAKDVLPNKPHPGRRQGRKSPLFLSLVTLAFNLDLQTRPSEGANTSSVNLTQIRSAVLEIFHTQTKNHGLMAQKQNFPQFTAYGNNDIGS